MNTIIIDNHVQRYMITNILEISGLSLSDMMIPSSAGYRQDGVTFGISTLKERYITIKFDIIRKTTDEVSREIDLICQILGKADFTLQVTSGSETKYLSPCRLSQGPRRERHGNGISTITLQIVAGDPYFKHDLDTVRLVDEKPNIFFKDDAFVIENDIFYPSFLRNSITIFNAGDVETSIHAVFTGGGTNPYIINQTTGEKLQIIGKLNATDTVHIDTAYGRKRVDVVNKDGQSRSAFSLISDDSVFFQLPPGENILQYGFDNTTTAAAVEITISERFYSHEY